MKSVIRLTGIALTMVALYGCGGAGGALTGSESTERGEAHAINPARNVSVVCEGTSKSTDSNVTVNITNNCNKNNVAGAEGAPEEE